MAQPFDPKLVDASVTTEELELATAAPAGDFPLADVQDQVDAEEDQIRGLVGSVPATPHQAILNLKLMRQNHIPIGAPSMCLYNIRHFAWEVAALWPTAKDAGEHGTPVHRFKSFTDVPRAMSIIFVNDHVWHITLGLGGGLNDTSDYHESGYNGVATIANTAEWCGATDWFGIETVNGVDVYPDPKKPKPQPKPWGLADRELIVHRDLRNARNNHAPQRRIDGLQAWDDRLIAKLRAAKIDRLPLS